MKIYSWNVNGFRACIGKGFWKWYDREDPDIVCLQETKITEPDFLKLAQHHELTPVFHREDAQLFDEPKPDKRKHPIYLILATAKKPGYSGVAILGKKAPRGVEIGVGEARFDDEGRTILADYDDFLLVNAYFPNGGRDLERIPFKLEYSDYLLHKLQSLRKKHKNIIICGDMNVAHTEIDIKNPKSNVNNSGFTPAEREWFSKFLHHKYVDIFRHLNPEARDVYTWWSYRPGVRERNIGWRIDYFVVTPDLLPHISNTAIHMKQKGSDHCPLSLTVKN
jgi:exodeoxyribonuclease-3